jgi:diguanylate cyclase (GGDEF)-like protein
MFLFPSFANGTSYAFLTLAAISALAACAVYVARTSGRLRTNWLLVLAGLSVWVIGVAISAWGDIVAQASRNVAFLCDFFFFFYGVPILFATCRPAEGHHARPFAWIDGAQAVVAGILAYVQIFSVIPFSNQASQPLPVSLLLQTYNIENVVLACAASLRLLSCPRRTEERRFYGILTGFLWLYAACTGIYNLLEVQAPNDFGFRDLLADMPFLFLAVAVLALPAARRQDAAQNCRRSSLSIFIENGSTVFFTFALLALGASIMRNHFQIGLASIAVALMLYGLRATLLQSRYMESQQALQQTRDRLEELSLQDALTGIPNRRRFDQVLEIEWSRANRAGEPLSLLMLDVDYFKRLNDQHGHRSGDECLVQIAHALHSCLPRAADLLARYGGEEFAVILPATGREGAENVAERMKQAVRDLNIVYDAEELHYTTISIGISTFEFPQQGSFGLLIDAADKALYQAKQNGRDRIEFASMDAFALAPAAV